MHIRIETLEKLAHLSRLELDPESREQLLTDLNNMLSFVEKLSEVDTSGIEPLTTMTHEVNRMRTDEPSVPLQEDEVFRNAPRHEAGHFRVPKVIS